MTKFDTSNYEGEGNELTPWLDYELTEALKNIDAARFDHVYLDVVSPGSGIRWRIFDDAGGFDYFEHATFPDGTTLRYGSATLRELEYFFDDEQSRLYQQAKAEAYVQGE